MYYIYNFIFYSLFGFLIETIFKLTFGFSSHSGILLGPYCPVYGFGITFIYILFEKINKKFKFKKFKKIFLFFISSFIILTIFELIGGYLIEIVFNKVFWNYKEFPLNIGKYISIEMSFIWSIGSIILYKFLKPLSDKLFFKTNKNIIKILISIMSLDSLITLLLNIFKNT